MRSHDKRRYATAGRAALALVLSGLLLVGCSSDPEAPVAAPSSSAPSTSASRSPTASASPTPSPASAAPVETAAAPAPVQPAPAPLTGEDAEKIIADYHQNSADLVYTVFDNGDGTFDVKVTSRSIAAQGGTGTAGIFTVEQDGSFALK